MRRLAILLLSTFSVVSLSFSLPKFSIRTGAKCSSCHVNPTGKGMRTEFGQNFGREDLPMATFRETTDLEDYSTRLSPNINFGGDFRTLMFYEQGTGVSSTFQMQGDLYIDFKLNKVLSFYYDKGIYSGFEVFGLAKILPANGYVKVGQFIPAYGTKVDDHNAFIRGGDRSGVFGGFLPNGYPAGLRFGERSEDGGVEIGFSPGIFSFQVDLLNGNPGGGAAAAAGDRFKTVSLRGEGLMKFGQIKTSLGGSIYNSPNATGRSTFYGAFGAISPLEELSLNAEFDIVETMAGATTKQGMIIWSELNYVVSPGIELKLGYSFYDPDRDLANGSITRITLGAEIFPLAGVELRPMLWINSAAPTSLDNNQFLLMTHFYL
jgi:hypothetical protein